MLVKICGLQTIEAANVAAEAGADFIGFVFAPSKRQITPERAAEIAQSLPPTVQKVGVFVNETVENMKKIADQVGLEIIQLHGDESPETVAQLPFQVIKAFSIDQINQQEIQSFPVDYYLIDSPAGKHRGGTGQSFDWQLMTELSIDPQKVILAGGLNLTNVQAAIQEVNPIGIDVSSGVETNGKKDHDKIKQFILHAKGRVN